MEIIKGNFGNKTEEEARDKQQEIRAALEYFLNHVDLSEMDEMILMLNSSEGNGTYVHTNCDLPNTYFLLQFTAQALLDGSITVGEQL